MPEALSRLSGSEQLELEAIRERKAYHNLFSPGLEAAYRAAQRRRYRLPRCLLFSTIATFLAFGPGHLGISAVTEVWRRPLQIGGGAAGALLLTTAWMTYRRLNPNVTRIAQAVSIIVAGWGAVFLFYLDLAGQLNFPSHAVSAEMIAIAFFGGFGWRRIVIGTTCCFTMSAVLQLWYEGATLDSATQVLMLSFMCVIAVLGVYTHEFLLREAWIAQRYTAVLAHTDPLTGLSTRADFNQLFESRLAQAHRDGRIVGLMLLDVDHFKKINDGYGHLFGDEVLRSVGALVIREVARRPLDLRVRYGGEEIAVLWYDVHVESLIAAVEKLLQSVRELELSPTPDGNRVRITASAGVCWVPPGITAAPLDVIRFADALMYRAKRDGRDRCVAESFGIAAA